MIARSGKHEEWMGIPVGIMQQLNREFCLHLSNDETASGDVRGWQCHRRTAMMAVPSFASPGLMIRSQPVTHRREGVSMESIVFPGPHCHPPRTYAEDLAAYADWAGRVQSRRAFPHNPKSPRQYARHPSANFAPQAAETPNVSVGDAAGSAALGRPGAGARHSGDCIPTARHAGAQPPGELPQWRSGHWAGLIRRGRNFRLGRDGQRAALHILREGMGFLC
jgi:hypothetical protein